MPRPRRLSPRLRAIVQLLVLVAAVLTGRASLADQYQVPTGSMEPTVAIGDRVLVNKLAYGLRLPLSQIYLARFARPARGDVVVLASPESGEVLLKRVVAGPGDRVAVAGGALTLDGVPVATRREAGQPVEELGRGPHPLGLEHGGGPAFGPVTVPPDCFLVLGDNRGNSHDGRAFGFVARRAILGRVVGVFWRGGSPTWVGL
jgi:signal peptidase I